jgi:hypothetical protein
MYRFSLAVGFGLALVWTPGCSSPPPPKGAAPAATVKGTITLDGKAIPTGELHFSMLGVPPTVVEIKDGAFSGEAPIGKNQVELFIYVETPSGKPGAPPSKSNTAPEKYWGPKTSLEATVEASGPNEFKFPLTSR